MGPQGLTGNAGESAERQGKVTTSRMGLASYGTTNFVVAPRSGRIDCRKAPVTAPTLWLRAAIRLARCERQFGPVGAARTATMPLRNQGGPVNAE